MWIEELLKRIGMWGVGKDVDVDAVGGGVDDLMP